MSRLDDIEARLDAKMRDIERRIDGGESVLGHQVGVSATPTQSVVSPAGQDVRTMAARPVHPVDDSAPPTMNISDLSAVSALEFRLAGLKPGDQLPLTGGRFPGDPQDEDDRFWAEVVDLARKANVTLGICILLVEGKQGPDKKFDGPTVFYRGIPEDSADMPLMVQRFVAMTAAYYMRRWRFAGVNDIHTLWSFAVAIINGGTLSGVEYFNNACSVPFGEGFTYLCFSPACCNQDTAGHEFTHSVSQDRVGWLQYYGEIGTLNESFSDIFAKFAFWAWHGRECSDPARWIYSGSRDMAHPENRVENSDVGTWIVASYYLQGVKCGNVKTIKTPQGDRQVHYGWYIGKDDGCGVHRNNGVIARLCFLLCEGERFVRDDGRGFEVKPIGFDRTEDLFGQLMFGPRRYLPKACNMYAFFNGILLAAEDLNFTTEERERIITACDAVNIIPPQNSSKFGSVSGMERKLNIRRANVPGTSSVSYAQAFAEEFGEELGLNAVGAGCSVSEESVIRPADLHAAVPTGGEVQVVLEQTWNGIPVFGASAIARVRDGDTVLHLENGFSMSLGGLRIGATIDAASAEKSVLENRRGQTVSSAQKIVFDPLLLGLTGTPCVAWLVRTEIGGAPEEQCIVDANSGRVLHSTPLRIID